MDARRDILAWPVPFNRHRLFTDCFRRSLQGNPHYVFLGMRGRNIFCEIKLGHLEVFPLGLPGFKGVEVAGKR